MSAPSMPPDNSMAIRQMELDEERRRETAAEKAAQERKAELLGLRNNAQTGARSSAKDFFTSQGLDAGRHSSAIESRLNSILSGIAPDDPNPGSYFSDFGQSVYNQEETAQRGKAGRGIDALFSPNFETQRLPFTIDDPFLSGIESEQRSTADEIIRNMLDRGVITSSGYDAAMGDLDRQGSGVRSRLNEIGTGLISTGQQNLRDVANRGRQGASSIQVDQQFDPYSFGSEADRLTSEFISTLGDQLRSRISGNLFSTSGLGALAGAAQGAGNTAFNPGAVAGIMDEDEDEDELETNPVF